MTALCAETVRAQDGDSTPDYNLKKCKGLATKQGLKKGGSTRGWIPHCPYLGAGCVALEVTQLVLHQHVAQVVDLDQIPQVQVISAQAWVG